jgi:hypothetical protein
MFRWLPISWFDGYRSRRDYNPLNKDVRLDGRRGEPGRLGSGGHHNRRYADNRQKPRRLR